MQLNGCTRKSTEQTSQGKTVSTTVQSGLFATSNVSDAEAIAMCNSEIATFMAQMQQDSTQTVPLISSRVPDNCIPQIYCGNDFLRYSGIFSPPSTTRIIQLGQYKFKIGCLQQNYDVIYELEDASNKIIDKHITYKTFNFLLQNVMAHDGVTGEMIAKIQLSLLENGFNDIKVELNKLPDVAKRKHYLYLIIGLTASMFVIDGSRLNTYMVVLAMQLELVVNHKMTYKKLLETASSVRIGSSIEGSSLQTEMVRAIRDYVEFKYPEYKDSKMYFQNAISHILSKYFAPLTGSSSESSWMGTVISAFHRFVKTTSASSSSYRGYKKSN